MKIKECGVIEEAVGKVDIVYMDLKYLKNRTLGYTKILFRCMDLPFFKIFIPITFAILSQLSRH